MHLDDGSNEFAVNVYANGTLDSHEKPCFDGPSVDTESLQLVLQRMAAKPIHLCLIVGKDSPGRFDMPSYKSEKNNISTAVKKLQVVGRLMQAYTHDEMRMGGFGNRCFQFVEQNGDSDLFDGTLSKSTPQIKVHILNSPRTVSDIRDPNVAQQNSNATESGWLFSHAMELVEQSDFYKNDGTATQAACLYLDTTWDKELELILGHAALGGGTNKVKMAICGSHGIHSWPSNFQQVIPCLSDNTKLTTEEVANDNNQCGTSWETFNVTAGAFLHEIGHSLGCPHQVDGVMLRDYITWNRSFTSKCINKNARFCHWNRLDLIRFLYHDTFSLIGDDFTKVKSTTTLPDDSYDDNKLPSLYLCNDGVVIKSSSGVYLVEVTIGELARYHKCFLPKRYGGKGFNHELILNYGEVCKELAHQGLDTNNLSLRVLSIGGNIEIEDFTSMMTSNDQSMQSSIIISDFGLGKGEIRGYKSLPLGRKVNEYQIIGLDVANIATVRVYHGNAVDGIRFFHSKASNNVFEKMFVQLDSSMMIGKESPHYSDFKIYENETITKFHVRSGWWIDGIQVETSLNRKSPMYGNPDGGNLSTLDCPNEKSRIVGMYCWVGKWLDLIGIIYSEDL